jgi:hypothetical protein
VDASSKNEREEGDKKRLQHDGTEQSRDDALMGDVAYLGNCGLSL